MGLIVICACLVVALVSKVSLIFIVWSALYRLSGLPSALLSERLSLLALLQLFQLFRLALNWSLKTNVMCVCVSTDLV